jgi:hypothetical protein
MPDMPVLMGPQSPQTDSSIVVVTNEQTPAAPQPADRGWWQDACRVWGEDAQAAARPADNPSNGS